MLKEFLREVRKAEEEIQNQGYASQFMPSGGVKKGKPTLEVKWDHGIYSARAWVNPGQQGYVFVRVFNVDTREYLSERLTGPPLKEYIGFSKDPTTLFSYSCRLYVRGDQLKQSFNAKFELWFHPSDGSPDRKLISAIDKILPDSERTIDTSRSGIVIDKSGVPVSDARVILYGAKKPAKGRLLPFECKVLETTTTNESGIFTITMKQPYKSRSLDFDRLFVVVQKDGFALGAQYFHSLEDSKDKAITLSKSTTISGTVINQNGDPIIGARVHVFPIKGRREDGNLIGLLSSTDLSTTNTDRFGRFLLDHIPIEAYAEFYVIAEGYLDKFTSHDLSGRTDKGTFEAGAPDVALTMEVKSGISGRVIDKHTGLPVSGLHIGFKRVGGDVLVPLLSTVTNEGGYYSINCSAGTYAVEYDTDHIPERWLGEEINVIVESGTTANVDLTVSRIGELIVQVNQVDSNEPISNVRVKIKDKNTGETVTTHYHTTGKEGIVWLNLPPGEYLIENLFKNGKGLLDTPESITIKPGYCEEREFKFDVTAEGKGMLVVVTDASKKPLPGVNIYLLPGNRFLGQTDEAGKSKILKEDFKEAVLAAFDQEYFERYGTHREFYIYAQDTENNMATIHRFYSGISGLIGIVLSDAFDILGRVVDVTGQPIAGAVVYPRFRINFDHFEFGNIEDCVTDSDGFYRIRALPYKSPRGYRYIITATGDGLSQQNIGIIGRVKGGVRKFNAYTLHPEELQAYIKQTPLDAKRDEVRVKDFILKKAKLSVCGVVVDVLGKPVGNAEVRFKGEGQPEFEPLKTGPDGKFRFEGLCEGNIKLHVKSEWSPGRFPSAHEFYNVDINVEAGNEEMRIIMTPKKVTEEKPEFDSDHSGLVEVQVTDSITAEPINNAKVVFQGEGVSNNVTISTNRNGLAYIVLPIGTNILSTVGGRKDYTAQKLNRAIDIEPGQMHDVEVQLNHRPSLTGTVVDDQGRPVGGAVVALFFARMDQEKVVTKGDGRFNFTYTPHYNGNLWLIVTQDRRNLAATFEITEDYSEDLIVVLTPVTPIGSTEPIAPYVLSGKGEWIKQDLPAQCSRIVVKVGNRSTGTPVAEARVVVSFNDGKGRYEGTTNYEGKVAFGLMKKDKYIVESISAPGYMKAEPKHSIVAGSGYFQTGFSLKPEPVFIKAIVEDENGNPVAGAKISSYHRRGPSWESFVKRPAITDKSGEATLNWTRESEGRPSRVGHLVLVKSVAEVFAAKSWLRSGPDEILTIQLKPRVVPVGRVIDSDGNGIEGLWVSIYLRGTNVFCGHVKTNSEGEFKGKPLPVRFGYSMTIDSYEKGYKKKRLFFNVLNADQEYLTIEDIVLEKR